jgi:hypothetical protein
MAAQVSPEQNSIFLTAHLFTFLIPIAQQPGQAVVLGRLSLCLWYGRMNPTIDSFNRGKHNTKVDCFANRWHKAA